MAEEKILDRVAKLLERANHKNTDAPERDACLKKADSLMMQHQIDEAMLSARTAGRSAPAEPIVAEAVFVNKEDEFYGVLAHVISVFMGLCKVRVIVSESYDRDAEGDLIWSEGGLIRKNTLKICGFPDDVEYFRMLWTSAFLVFSSKLSPRWDNAHTLAWNIRVQKESGVKWGSIYDLAKANGWSGYRRAGKVPVDTPVVDAALQDVAGEQERGSMDLTDTFQMPPSWLQRVARCPADKGYFKKLYELQCRHDGIEATNHTQRNAAYRESYAYGFLAEIRDRVGEMHRIREQHVASVGGAQIALRDRDSIVKDFFRNMFPMTEGIQSNRRHDVEGAGSAAGHIAGKNVDLLGGRNRMGGDKKALEG